LLVLVDPPRDRIFFRQFTIGSAGFVTAIAPYTPAHLVSRFIELGNGVEAQYPAQLGSQKIEQLMRVMAGPNRFGQPDQGLIAGGYGGFKRTNAAAL
jgi:hypothetical protein